MRLFHHRAQPALMASALIVGLIGLGLPGSGIAWAIRAPLDQSSTRAAALAASTKPDWRGADLGNTGRLSSGGPATLPTQVFNAHPELFGNSYGIELDGAGNIIYGTGTGHVYSFSPSGTQNWLATLATTEGSDLAGPPSHPVASSDGNIYIGGDNGNLYQINALSGAVSTIFSTASSKALLQTPKIGADNTLYVGAADGNLYHLSPSSGSSTTLYTFAASGSTQTSGAAAGLTSVAPFVFYGETAVDAVGNAYAVSTDTNPNGTGFLGTVYKISPTGALVWKKPVQGAAPGAVVLAANPAAPGQTLVIVANRTPQVNAFDAATGALVWTFVPASNTPIAASPALSPDGSTLYIDNNADTLYALNVSTGALNTSFNGTGSVAVGSNVSPIVDAAGNVYIESSNGALQGYSPAGAQLFTIPGGSGAGQSGAANGGYMSPAISANGTIYGGGNKATVRGFQAASTSTSTPAPTNTSTNTPVPTDTPTNTSTNTPVPTATKTNTAAPTNTATNTPVPTSTSTNTAVPTDTPTNTSTRTAAPTATSTPTDTSTPINTTTNTALPADTSTNTAVPTNTNTPINTATNTPTPTNTAVPTSTVTDTPVNTATDTAVAMSSDTPVNTATSTPSTTPADTATNTPQPTMTPTSTSTNTAAPTTMAPTSTPAASDTAVPATGTATMAATATSTAVASTSTATAEVPTGTPTTAPGNTPSPTPTQTMSATPTAAEATGTPELTATGTGVATTISTPTTTATSTAAGTSPTAIVITLTPTATATSASANTTTPTAQPSTSVTAVSTATPAGPSATATSVPTQTALPTQPTTGTATPSPTGTVGLPSATTTATATVTPTSTATPVEVRIHVYPRGVVRTTPRLRTCRFVANLIELQRGCELVSSTSAPRAALVYTVRYGNGLIQRFTDRADARGHSLRVFNIAYVPPAGTPLLSPLSLVRVTVRATLLRGSYLGSASTTFRVARPRGR